MKFDPAQLAALEAVLRLGSFDAAAAELSVTPSAVSQRIRALEDRTGSPLVIRATPCRPTETGARLSRHALELAALDAALAAEIGQAGAPSRLRIALNADSLDTWAIQALAECDHLYDIVPEDEAAAHDRLRAGEVSAAITLQDRAIQGSTVVPLGRMRYVATCAPAFHARHFAGGIDRAALSRAPMLDFSHKDRLQRGWLEQVAGPGLSPPCHHLPSTHGFVQAALSGLGWGLNPLPLVRDHLAAGRLVALFPETPRDVALFWQYRSLAGPALAPLTRALRRHAGAFLEPL